MNLLQWAVSLQTSIHEAVTASIAAFADAGDLAGLMLAWPVAVLFGAVHALTPGHNKLVLAAYAIGERPSTTRAMLTSALMSAAHIGSAVVVALGASWLVSRTLASAGQAPLLESISRIMMLAIGLYMLLRAARLLPHVHGSNAAFALGVGLIPCPLTLFVMVYAVTIGVPAAGALFALAMLFGVGAILCVVAIVATTSAAMVTKHARFADFVSRFLEAGAGLLLIAVAIAALAL